MISVDIQVHRCNLHLYILRKSLDNIYFFESPELPSLLSDIENSCTILTKILTQRNIKCGQEYILHILWVFVSQGSSKGNFLCFYRHFDECVLFSLTALSVNTLFETTQEHNFVVSQNQNSFAVFGGVFFTPRYIIGQTWGLTINRTINAIVDGVSVTLHLLFQYLGQGCPLCYDLHCVSSRSLCRLKNSILNKESYFTISNTRPSASENRCKLYPPEENSPKPF